jgi:hypothetical protein
MSLNLIVDQNSHMVVANDNTHMVNQRTKSFFIDFFFFHPQSMAFVTMVACNLTFVVDINHLCCLQLKPMGTNCITNKETNHIFHVYKMI